MNNQKNESTVKFPFSLKGNIGTSDGLESGHWRTSSPEHS